jgi:hypothetical protein
MVGLADRNSHHVRPLADLLADNTPMGIPSLNRIMGKFLHAKRIELA